MRRTWPLLLLAIVSAAAYPADPPGDPVLTINTRMHTSSIRRIDADASGRLLITGSLDKTARLWDAATGDLLRVLRPPLDSGNDGKVYAVALSPDGATAAVGGWTGYDWDGSVSIYLFDTSTGEMIRRVSGLSNAPYDLRFSPDGRRLAAVLGARCGVVVFDVEGWKTAAQLQGYGDDAHSASFDGKGRLVTSCWDGKVRLYGPDLRLLKETALTGGSRPLSAEFSPDGTGIAVGFQDAAEIQILDASTLRVQRRIPFEKKNRSDYLGVVRWARDGGTLWCAGALWTRTEEGWKTAVRRWNLADLSFSDHAVAGSSILDLRVLPDGGAAWCGYLPDMGRLDARGRSPFSFRGETMSFMTDGGDRLRLAPDGLGAGFQPQGSDPLTFYVGNRQLSRMESSWPAASPSAGGTVVAGWDSNAPTINGKAAPILERDESCRSAAVTASGNAVVWGTDWYLDCTDASGRIRWKTYAPAAAWSVQVSEKAGIVIGAFGDGTVRWYRLRDGRELMALFAHADGSRWVLWTPSGYFDCSPGGQDLIGWSVNAGAGGAADFFPVGSFSSRFYRPDVTQTILGTLDEKAAVAAADLRRPVQAESTGILAALPPVAVIRSPGSGAVVSSPTVLLAAVVRAPNGDPVREVRALVDGRPSGAVLKDLAIVSRTGERVSLETPLPPGEHRISLIARNFSGWSQPAAVTVTRAPSDREPAPAQRRLIALLAGAAGDLMASDPHAVETPDGAGELARALLSRRGAAYAEVSVESLWGAAAPGLAERLGALCASTSLEDTVLVVLRGFGATDDEGAAWFLADPGGAPDPKKGDGLRLDAFLAAVSRLPARVAVFLEIRPLDSDFDLTGFANRLSAADAGAAVTARRPASGTAGLLVSLAEGLAGKADSTGDGAVSVTEMARFLDDRLGSGGVLSAKPETVRDFPLLASPGSP